MHALAASGWTGAVAAWLVNYLIHSTLLLGAAWLASRWLAGRHTAAEEWLWRSALVGALLTASLQLAFGGAVTTAAGEATAARASLERTARVVPAPYAEPAPLSFATSAGSASALGAPPPAEAAPAPRRSRSPRLPVFLLALWATGAACFVGRLAGRWVAFRRRLAGRRPIAAGPLAEMLEDLAAPVLAGRAFGGRAVRLTATRRFPVPFARGTARPEICMPERAVCSLHPALQQGILAHEVAHLVRRDPLWLAALRLAEALFFFQPLHRVASRRLLELSEYHCDDWAARVTGRGKELARCLAEVAAWLVDRPPAMPVPAMGRSRSSLARRIERLLADRAGAAAERRVPRWALPLAALAMAATVAFAPGLTLAGDAPEAREVEVVEPNEEIVDAETPEAEEWPEPALAPGDLPAELYEMPAELAGIEVPLEDLPTPLPELAPAPEAWPVPGVEPMPTPLPHLAPMPGVGPMPTPLAHVAPMPGAGPMPTPLPHLAPMPGVGPMPTALPRVAAIPGMPRTPHATPAPRPVIADAWAPPPPDAPPVPRAPRTPPPPGSPPAAAPVPAPGAPPPPMAPRAPRAPQAWSPADELEAIADAMEDLAEDDEIDASHLARLLRRSARVALQAGAISTEEHDRMAAASATRAAEASRSPDRVAEMAAETHALAASLHGRHWYHEDTPRPPREPRSPRAWQGAEHEWRAAVEDAQRQALESLDGRREAIADAVAEAQRQALEEVSRELGRQQQELQKRLADLDRELAGQQRQVEEQVRRSLERELRESGDLTEAEIERQLGEVDQHVERAMAEAERHARASLERMQQDLERARREIERSQGRPYAHEGVRSPRRPRAEAAPTPEAPEAEEPIEPPG